MNREEYIIWEASIKTVFKPVGQNQPEEAPVQKENQAKASLREKIQGLASNAKRTVDSAVSKGVEQIKNTANKITHHGNTTHGAQANANLQAKHANDVKPTNKSTLAQAFQKGVANIKKINNNKQPKQLSMDFKGANKAHQEQVKAEAKAQAQAIKDANLDNNGQARLNLNKSLTTSQRVKNNLVNTKNQVAKGANEVAQRLKAGYKDLKANTAKTVDATKEKVSDVAQKVRNTFDKSPKQLKLDYDGKSKSKEAPKEEKAEQLKLDTYIGTTGTQATFNKDGKTYTTANAQKVADNLKGSGKTKTKNALVPVNTNKQLPAVVQSKPGAGTFTKDGKTYTTATTQQVADNLKNKEKYSTKTHPSLNDIENNKNQSTATTDTANTVAQPKATTDNGKEVANRLKNSGKTKSKQAFDVWRDFQKNKNNPEEPELKTDKEQVKTDNKVSTTADATKNPEKTIGQKVKDGLNKLYDGAIRADVKAKNFKQNLIDDYKSRRERIENEESLKRLEKFAKDHKANRDILDKIANIKANMNNAGGEKTVQDYLDKAREQVRGKQGATQNTNTRGTSVNGNAQTNTTKNNTENTNTSVNNENPTNVKTANVGDGAPKAEQPKAEPEVKAETNNGEQPTQPTNNTEVVNEPVDTVAEQPETDATAEQPATTETGRTVKLNLERPKAVNYETDENGNVLNKNVTFQQADVDRKSSLIKSLSMRPNSKGQVIINVNGKGVDITKNADRITRLLGNALYYHELNKLKGNTLEGIKTELMRATNLPREAVATMIKNVKASNGRIGDINYKGPEVDENGIQHLTPGQASGSVDKWSQFIRVRTKNGAKGVTPYSNQDVNALIKQMSDPNFDYEKLDDLKKAAYDDLKECGLISVGQDGKHQAFFNGIDANGNPIYTPETTGQKAIVNGKTVNMPAQPQAQAEPVQPQAEPTQQVEPAQPQAQAEPVQQQAEPTTQPQVEPAQQPQAEPTQPNNVINNALNIAVTNAVNRALGINQQPVQQPQAEPIAQPQAEPVQQPAQQQVEPAQQPQAEPVQQPTVIETPEIENTGEAPTLDNVDNINPEAQSRIPVQPVLKPAFDFTNADATRNNINQYNVDLDNQAKQEYETQLEKINQNYNNNKHLEGSTEMYQQGLEDAQAQYQEKLAQNRQAVADMQKAFDAQLAEHQRNLELTNAKNEINNALGGDDTTLTAPKKVNKRPSEMSAEEIRQYNINNAKARYNPSERLTEARREAFDTHFKDVAGRVNQAVNKNDLKTVAKLLGPTTANDSEFIKYMNWRGQVINKMREDGAIEKTKKGWKQPDEIDVSNYLRALPDGQKALDYYDNVQSNSMIKWYKNAWRDKIYNTENANIPVKLPSNDYQTYLKGLGLEETTDKDGNAMINTVASKYPVGVQKRPFQTTFKALATKGDYKNLKAMDLSPELQDALDNYARLDQALKSGFSDNNKKLTDLERQNLSNDMDRIMYEVASNKDFATELGFVPKDRVTKYNTGKNDTGKGIKLSKRIGKNKNNEE